MQTPTYAARLQVRFVIGSGGATIKSIRQETSTFITSDRNEADPSAPVVFRIEGHSAEGVEAARVRIQEIVGMCAWFLATVAAACVERIGAAPAGKRGTQAL